MRGYKLRFASAVLLAVLCGWLVTRGGAFVAAQPVQPAKDKDKKDKEKDRGPRPADEEALPIGLPYERGIPDQLKAAEDYLGFTEIPWNTVCSVLQKILDANSDSFVTVEDKVGDKVVLRRISVKTRANRIIAMFPKEGLEFYQQSYGQAAAALLDEAVKNGYDLAQLTDLTQRYFYTRAGAEGTVLLGTIYLERGNYLEAAYAFERLLTRPAADEFLTPRTLFKASLALKRSGDPRHAGLYQATVDRLQKATARDGLVIGRKTFTFAQLQTELDRPLDTTRAAVAAGDWATRYGNPARNAAAEGGPPFLVPAFDPVPMLYTGKNDANTFLTEELERQFDRENKDAKASRPLPLPGFFPITTPDLVIFRSYDGVYAFPLRDHTHGGKLYQAGGEPRWVSRSMFGVHQLMTPGFTGYSDPGIRQEVTRWWTAYKGAREAGGESSILFENPLLGSLSHDGQYVYFLDDVAIPPPPQASVNEFGGINPGMPQFKQSGELGEAIRSGELVAVDMATGNRVWELGRFDRRGIKLVGADQANPYPSEEEADKATSAFRLCLNAVFLGPPLPVNGRLYALIEQAGVIRLLCLDPKNLVESKFLVEMERSDNRAREVQEMVRRYPALLWSQKLGKPNNPLPADSIRRYQGAFLAAGEGVIVCPTNSGAVIGVDVMSHSLLWAHAYSKQETNTRRPVMMGPDGQPVYTSRLPAKRWRAAAPIVAAGRVVLAAYDSPKLECLDVRTGKLLWSTPREEDDLYVGGVVNGKVIVVGKEKVRAYHLTGEDPTALTPKPAWDPVRIDTPTGHGVAGKNVFFVPVRPANAGAGTTPAAELWAINADTGAVASKTAARKRGDPTGEKLPFYGLGNLAIQDGLVVAQSAWEVAVYPQLEVKKAEMDRRLAANPKDPVGLADRGELLLDDGKLKEAIADFKEADRNNPPDPVKRRIRDKLYVAYTELLRDNFAAGEPFLKEYEALCEVPLDTDDPHDRKRREDETVRRKLLYLRLLARGREKQGRLGEALDHYLAFASLGQGKTLIDVPEEFHGKILPEVWARGRIEGMIRSADPAARKALEDRVAREWEAVRSGNDLNRLREFVAVFGPYFPAGAQAQLKLAEALLLTNNPDDARDAQVHLGTLRATAEDPAVRARATEALARLMVKSGQLEDAVGLYLQLGKDYPDVVVRDGKTGADFLTDLLTDKRLLPYLEPGRYPVPPRVKAEQKEGQQRGMVGATFEVEPEGDLLPAYRRLRFVIDTNPAGGSGVWYLRGIDRSNEVERCKFELHPIQSYPTPLGSLPLSRFVQAHGRLLLVQLGPWVYCLDLAQKSELWRRNLLGEGAATVAPGGTTVDFAPNGDAVVRYAEGYHITLGRAAALHAGYVCLLTRDGLEVIEPFSKRQLWTRRGIRDRTQVYGDARYVLLVETNAAREPVSTTLLRAVDGVPVEGAPNAGPVLAGKAYRVYGRTVLIAEGKAGEPRALRMYDVLTGKDLWRREYDPKSVPIRPLSPEWAGFVRPTGEVEILAARTGQPVGTFRLDERRAEADLAGCVEAQLFADADRFYLTLDRDATAPALAPARGPRTGSNYSLRTQRVNGPMYCFDRATGKRLWFVDELLDNQSLVLERFGDLPVVIAAGTAPDKSGTLVYRVVVVEKQRGKVLFHRGLPPDHGSFHSLVVDLKNETVDLHRPDLRVHISPDDGQGDLAAAPGAAESPPASPANRLRPLPLPPPPPPPAP